jgi:hypothetical protein
LGQLLVGSEPPDVRLVRVQGAQELTEDPQGMKNAERDLHTDRSVAALEADKRVAGDASAISQLGLCEPAELAPGLQIRCEIA